MVELLVCPTQLRNLKSFCFSEPATLIKNEHKELAVAVSLVASCVDVGEFPVVSITAGI